MNYYTFAFFNLPLFLFALLTIRLMVQQADLKWILLLGLLASFSYGNGLLVWIIGLLISLVQANYKRLFLYFGVLIFLLLFYFLQDIHTDSSPVINAEFLIHVVLYFIQLHAYFINWPAYTLPWGPLLVGIGILVLFGYLLIKAKLFDRKVEKSYLLFYLLFLSLSIALISLARASVNGLTATVVDHYKIYSCLFLGCLIYYTTEQIKLSTKWSYSFLVVSILITFINYTTYIPRMYSHFTYQMADALNYYSTKKWLFYPVIQGKKEYAFVNDVSKSVIEKGFYAGIAPHFAETNTRYEAQIDSTDAHLMLQATKVSYSPLTENAFFVVNCNGLQYHFPVLFDRSWKDILKCRVRQETARTVIDWKAMNEPCLKRPNTIRFAILKNGYLTYYPLYVMDSRTTK